MATSTMQRGSDETPGRDRLPWRDLGIGAVAGLVAGLVLTLAQLLARLWAGVGPAVRADRRSDRAAAPGAAVPEPPGLVGGYNQLQQLGIVGPTLGQLTLAVVLGIAFTRTSVRSGSPGCATRFLVVTVALVGVALVAALSTVLPTSHIGLSPSLARLVTILALAVSWALFIVALVLSFRWMHGVRQQDEPTGGASPVTRRVVLAGGVGAGLAVATAGVGTVLFRQAVFS